MPCIFCLAVFALFAGAITTAVLDEMEQRLEALADGPVTRTVDSDSVTTYETQVVAPRVPGQPDVAAGRSVPVRVTIYKKHKRVRIQVMTHDLSRAEAEALEDLLAAALELTIVDRSDAHDEAQVREAFGEEAVEADRDEEELTEKESAQQQTAQQDRGQQSR